MLEYLPYELLVSIFLNLSILDILRISESSKRYHILTQDEYLWKGLVNRDFNLNLKPQVWLTGHWLEIYKNLYTLDGDRLALHSLVFGEVELFRRALTKNMTSEIIARVLINGVTNGYFEIIKLIPYRHLYFDEMTEAKKLAKENDHLEILEYLNSKPYGPTGPCGIPGPVGPYGPVGNNGPRENYKSCYCMNCENCKSVKINKLGKHQRRRARQRERKYMKGNCPKNYGKHQKERRNQRHIRMRF